MFKLEQAARLRWVVYGKRHSHIIPPTWSKSLRDEETRDIFVPIWKAAHDAIRQAHRIFFIGYSFPITDQYFRDFLAFALSKNDNLDHIVVVNPDEAVEERFRTMLGGYFQRYFTFIPLRLENIYGSRKARSHEGWLRQYDKLLGR